MRISDWSSDVCSSDLFLIRFISFSLQSGAASLRPAFTCLCRSEHFRCERDDLHELLGTQFTGHGPEDARADRLVLVVEQHRGVAVETNQRTRSEEHTSELQSLMRISSAVSCLKKQKQ